MNQGSDTVAAFDRRMKQTKNLLLQRLEQSDNSNAAYWDQQDDVLLRNRPFNQPL